MNQKWTFMPFLPPQNDATIIITIICLEHIIYVYIISPTRAIAIDSSKVVVIVSFPVVANEGLYADPKNAKIPVVTIKLLLGRRDNPNYSTIAWEAQELQKYNLKLQNNDIILQKNNMKWLLAWHANFLLGSLSSLHT